MNSSTATRSSGLIAVLLSASLVSSSVWGQASEAPLLKPEVALPEAVGASDSQPGYVMPTQPGDFRAEEALIIGDPEIGPSIELGDVVREVKQRVDFDINFTGGTGYDSNTRLTSDNEIGAWVTWVAIGASVDVGDEQSMGLYYGANVNGHLFSYETGRADGGRDNVEPMLDVYVGMRGAKTNVRVDSQFRINNGNVADLSDTEREQRRADSSDYNVTISGQRTMAHGYMTGAYSLDSRDFGVGTGLNDTEGQMADWGWFYRPAATPKTDFGFGLRVGKFDTENNFLQTYVQPSLRVNYALSAKTQVFSRFGYDLRDFDGVGSIGSTSAFVYELGAKWSPTRRIGLQSSIYKDFSPSVVSGFEDFNRSGIRSSATYALPWWGLQWRSECAFERADYFSTLSGVTSERADDYWLFGSTLSRSFAISELFTGDVALFYYLNSNDSTIQVNEFDQHFTGVRLGLTY